MAWKAFLFTQPDFFHFLFKSWHRGSPRGHEACQVSTLAWIGSLAPLLISLTGSEKLVQPPSKLFLTRGSLFKHLYEFSRKRMEKNATRKCTIWHVRFVVTALDILHWNFCKNCVWEKATNHHFARLKHALYKLFSVILPASQCELTPTATYKKEYCSPVTSQGADSEATLISHWCNVHKFLLLCSVRLAEFVFSSRVGL